AGGAPLTVRFSSLAGESVSVAADFNGDGITDFTGPMRDGHSFTYTEPGVYLPTVSFLDDQGNRVTARTIVQVYDRTSLDGVLKSKWNGMKTALMGNNIERALLYFNPTQQDRYRTVFNTLALHIAQIAGDMQDIEQIYLIESVAKYRIRKTQLYGAQWLTLTYHIYFIHDTSSLSPLNSLLCVKPL